MVKKLSNVKIAASTLEIVEAGYYKNNAGLNVSIRKQVEAAVNSSKMYTPQECEDLKKNETYLLNKGNVTEFFVWNCTTLEAAERLTNEHENVAALNFASAKFPGGGFKTGAKAQEESLARSSALYHCLKKHPKFYSNNKRENNCIYTDHIIYSPQVPFFRRDNGDLLQNGPYLLSVLSAPAVHYGNAHQRIKRTGVLEERMEQRAHYILSIAAHHEHEVLILGAWGCGVFKFPVDECAGIFYDLLVGDEAPFQFTFKKVVFAILKPQQVEAFEDFFCDDEENPNPEVPQVKEKKRKEKKRKERWRRRGGRRRRG
eukprot:Phypoly_transcript_12307.p1 GENE.Phypoly_transcript_12307~~Phypoly_transcript_12307.p1  ORF type:complete len:315 (+),score=49.99 Phypoly_transcript_12307:79-1023(+)